MYLNRFEFGLTSTGTQCIALKCTVLSRGHGTDRRRTDVQTDGGIAASLNTPLPKGGGIIMLVLMQYVVYSPTHEQKQHAAVGKCIQNSHDIVLRTGSSFMQ